MSLSSAYADVIEREDAMAASTYQSSFERSTASSFPGLKRLFLPSLSRVVSDWSLAGSVTLPVRRHRLPFEPDEALRASPEAQEQARPKAFVEVPPLRESGSKITILQQWIGRVARVIDGRFLAVVEDVTNAHNPPEEIELDVADISESDLPLLAEGATFYWSIFYHDSPGGQRMRNSSLRFARQPRLSPADVHRIFEQADCMVALLERD